VNKGGRQRTDATHVYAAVRDLNRVELVAETMRAALEALAVAVPSWLASHLPDEWFIRYGSRIIDFRLPRAETARTAYANTVGEDGYRLLDIVYDDYAPAWLAQIEAVQRLRLIWIQQYYRDTSGIRLRGKEEGLPPAAQAIVSPYDADARYGVKRGVGWSGYKAHFEHVSQI
jgi:hypothetical protein